jgi:hypothetical protein
MLDTLWVGGYSWTYIQQKDKNENHSNVSRARKDNGSFRQRVGSRCHSGDFLRNGRYLGSGEGGMSYSHDLTRFRALNWLDKADLQKELDFFMEIAERAMWDVDDETIKYMTRLDQVIKALS